MTKGKTRYAIETVRVKPWELLKLWREGYVIRNESLKMTAPEFQDDELRAMWLTQTAGLDGTYTHD